LRGGLQDGRKLAVMFEQVDAVAGNPIDSRTSAKEFVTHAKIAGLNEAPESPIEAVTRTFPAAKSHQIKELIVADKLRITDLSQQRDISSDLNDQTIFRVPHKELLKLILRAGSVQHDAAHRPL
jgi:hypothetical protein